MICYRTLKHVVTIIKYALKIQKCAKTCVKKLEHYKSNTL